MAIHQVPLDSSQSVAVAEPKKGEYEAVEQPTAEEDEQCTMTKGGAPLMRSKIDDLSVWQTVRRYKSISVVATGAAFSAALDGYRMGTYSRSHIQKIAKSLTDEICVLLEINLNGGIVSNEGFIRQMASPGTKIIEGKYVSAWGGIQSAGQTIGQIVRTPTCN
jgi:hypothetical protein